MFRLLVHVLGEPCGEEWEKSTDKGDQTSSFIKGALRICQGSKATTCEMWPDILLEKDRKPIAAVEIKLWLTNGEPTLKNAIDRLKTLSDASDDQFKGAVIIYTTDNRRKNSGPRRIESVIEGFKRENHGWLDILVLQSDGRLFKDVITKSLGLDNLRQ